MSRNIEATKRLTAVEYGYNRMFASRDKIEDAVSYVIDIADSCGKHNKVGVITAAGVLTNTLLETLAKDNKLAPTLTDEELEKIGEEIAALLGLKTNDKFRFDTSGGDKTALGLALTMFRLLGIAPGRMGTNE